MITKLSGVARGGGGGGGPPRVSLFWGDTICNTSQTEKKTTICLISLEMLITLKLTKNDLKPLLKKLFRGTSANL